jgi:hypothetical protein
MMLVHEQSTCHTDYMFNYSILRMLADDETFEKFTYKQVLDL